MTLLIDPRRITVGKHSVTYERKRTWEDPKHAKGLETIQQSVCRIHVTATEHRSVASVTYEEAKRGGFANLHLFLAAFESERYVWVARFDLLRDDDPIRLLGRGGGYTSSTFLTVDEEVEAVPADVQAEQTKEGRTFDELRAEKRRETWQREREAMRLDERYREERARAELLGTDVSREEAALRRTVENMRRKNDRRAA